MDGTLLSNMRISPANARAIQACVQKGVRVCIATGRIVESARSLLADAGLYGLPIVGANGSCTVDENGNVIAEYFINAHAASAVIRAWADMHGAIHGMSLPNSLYLGPDAETARKLAMAYKAAWLPGQELADVLVDDGVLTKPPVPYYKMLLVNREAPEIFTTLRPKLEQAGGLFVTTSWPGNLEIMPAGVNKGRGLAALCAHYSIAPENVMAMGDNENDLQMLAFAGFPVLMGNYAPAMAGVSDVIAPHCDEDGVAWALEKFVIDDAKAFEAEREKQNVSKNKIII